MSLDDRVGREVPTFANPNEDHDEPRLTAITEDDDHTRQEETKMPKALLFDLDGTLTDTHAIRLANWLEVLRPHDVDVDMNLYREKLSGRSSSEAVNELVPDLSGEEKAALLRSAESGYRFRTTQAGPIAGLDAFLQEAHRRGIGLALVSNAPREEARRSLEALGLAEAFEPMVLAEDVGAEKPDPAPYEAALEKLGISPQEALAFEDTPSGMGGAVEAGIPVVGLVATHSPNELREAGAEFVVGDFADWALYQRLDY